MKGPLNQSITDSMTPQASEVRKAEQAQFTRSDLATTRRALSDLETQADRLSQQVNENLSKKGNVGIEDFEAAWAQRVKLNNINQQIGTLKESISEILPSINSSPRLSHDEREQIRGLYQSRLYTQQQIAQQYGISQPTVGDIVRRAEPKTDD